MNGSSGLEAAKQRFEVTLFHLTGETVCSSRAVFRRLPPGGGKGGSCMDAQGEFHARAFFFFVLRVAESIRSDSFTRHLGRLLAVKSWSLTRQ